MASGLGIGRDEALAIQRRALADCLRMVGSSAPGSAVFERDGVTAAIVPASPHRSIVNSVSYEDPEALLGVLEELGSRYEQAGVDAWTVWVPDFERETIARLEAAGHRFDGKPLAMVLELERFEAPEIGDLDWDAEASPDLLGPMNELAYGDHGAGMALALAAPPVELVRLYQARVDGEPACVLGTIDHEGDDLGIYFVATDPERRGRGLATRLMVAALADAKRRGLRTSSLQASAMGEPIYRKLGYEPHFHLQLYERRRPAAG